MSFMHFLRSRRNANSGLALIASALIGACSAQGGSPVEDVPTSIPEALPASICPSCGPSTGGESGDFPGGSSALCTEVLSTIELDDEQARALGYDVDEMRRQLARTIDLPFTWGAPSRFSGFQGNDRYEIEPASGYALNETRISLRFEVADALSYERPDPNYCDGTTCRRGASEGPQDACQSALHFDLQVEVQTADEAVRGTLTGRATKLANSDFFARAFADLAVVTGKLHLAPKMDLGSLTGALTLVVRFVADEARGTLTPTIRFGAATGESATVYTPIVGRFQSAIPSAGTLAGAGGTLAGPGGSDEPKK